MIGFGGCGDDHAEGASGPAFRHAIGHQARPDQGGLLVEREHPAGE